MKKITLCLLFAGALGVVSCQKGKTSDDEEKDKEAQSENVAEQDERVSFDEIPESEPEDRNEGNGENDETPAIERGNQVGQMFVDFEATYEGKTMRLSDYVGKGRYVLADFWASWCGPCRMEVPNLIAVHNKYAGAKFTVLGIATWDEPADTKAAVDELGINYPQILNAQQAGSDAYGIEGIPEIILFAPDGTILARGLRGEAIEKAVSEALASCE